MRTVLVLVLFSVLSAFAVGCMPSTTRNFAFEPRAYPYVPEIGLDGPAAANLPSATK